jgi:organic radical activating enzyme
MKMYGIKEIFDTLQGEGTRAGARSVFVRFAGCNLWSGDPAHRQIGRGACARWCDTDFAHGEGMTADQILKKMGELWPGDGERWCVLTGGEPLLQLDSDLVVALRNEKWQIAIETNGTILPKFPLNEVSHVALSPKRSDMLIVLEFCDELKVVLPGDDESPWTDAELLVLADRLRALDLFVQPQDPIDHRKVQVSYLHGEDTSMYGKQYRENLKRCIDFVKAHPDWRLGLQTHKFANLP